jgi:hypothetical protein
MVKLKHPEDTNDYIDLPDGIVLTCPICYGDRIHALCLDPHHCTLANALARNADSLGILRLGRRGVSRRYVSLLLDTNVHKWADSGRWYRGKLNSASADLTVELDMLAASPQMQRSTRKALQRQVAGLPDGELTVWETLVITAPSPSERKGYRQGIEERGHRGSGDSKSSHAIPRRHWVATPVTV